MNTGRERHTFRALCIWVKVKTLIVLSTNFSNGDDFTGSYGAHVAVVIALVLAAIIICLLLVCFCSFMSKRMKKKRSGAAQCGTGGFGLKKNTGYFKVRVIRTRTN